VRLNVSVTLEQDGRRESASAGAGGRAAYDEWIAPDRWKALVRRALKKAETNLQSIPAPAGEMEVVLGPGWPAVLLHEAVGHGLEGDFNRKGTSVYSGRIGEQVASKGVTVVDDGTMEDRRGSLSFDDEGTPTQRNVLIEDGVLKGYMQDRQNARLMGQAPSGNGRRESYDAGIMPRMTNTIMLAGDHDPGEMVASVKRGIWAVDFGGGQVDITSGNFVFQCTEAYLVENGKVVAPVKNATLIGHGPTALSQVEMIGNDFAMDDGVGTCGKAGQSVPVGVGQPSLKVGGLTVGGAG
jgi:TldD protein